MKDHYGIRKAELIRMNRGTRRAMRDTLSVFRAAVEYLGNVVLDHWDEISEAGSERAKKNVVETLVHKTGDNPSPLYRDFDRLFYKMPCYYRRSAIEFTIGQVQSYLTRLRKYNQEKYEAMSNGRRFGKKPPRLNLQTNACPTLYKGNMFKVENGKVMIKLFVRNTWDWVVADIPARDIKSLIKAEQRAWKTHCPSLTFRYNKYYLVFPFEFRVSKFPEVALCDQTVLGTDLGINNGAVCSVVDANGNVLHRRFDPFKEERARIDAILWRIRRIQKQSGTGQSLSAVYTKLEGLKEDYVCRLSRWIVDLAIETGVYGIVLEHLGKMKGRGSRKDRIHHWCKKNIASMVKGMAFREGIRVFFINPRNTSVLAFDGSGKVTRDPHNFSLCTFASGKQYHCDLSASYNIAARYFLRAMQNSMSSEAWARLVAKVPCAAKRTDCTLATLRSAACIDVSKEAA